jgi:PAS domain S-box-containing protein
MFNDFSHQFEQREPPLSRISPWISALSGSSTSLQKPSVKWWKLFPVAASLLITFWLNTILGLNTPIAQIVILSVVCLMLLLISCINFLGEVSPNAQAPRFLSMSSLTATTLIPNMSTRKEAQCFEARRLVGMSAINRELHREKQQFEIIFENLSDVVILLSVEGQIWLANPRLQELLGYSAAELLNQNLSHVICAEDQESFTHALMEAISSHKAQRIEVIMKRKDGQRFCAELALAAFEQNDQMAIISTLRDISPQQMLIQELQAALVNQRVLTELKTQFISTVSHEYRTPLTVIKMYADLLLQYQQISDKQRQRYLETIQVQIARMTCLMNNVLELNRQEALGMQFSPRLITIHDLFEEIIHDYRQINPQYNIVFRVTGHPQPIWGDAQLLRQIMSNLLSNAIKYSASSKDIDVFLGFENLQATMSIKDRGIGIPEKDLGHLFDIYYRSSNANAFQGTGLGLAIVKQAVEAHGGTISVDSRVGYGSEFLVALPLLPQASESPPSHNR